MRGVLVFALGFILLGGVASAECWRLKDGSIIETQANSSPPVRGAVKVTCPRTSQPPLAAPSVEKRGVTTFDKTSGKHSDNCVLFARSIVRSLPHGPHSEHGLEFMHDKEAIINASRPTEGSVAIIRVRGKYAENGHVAVVERVTQNSITIREANFSGKGIQRRRAVGRDLADAAAQLDIIGYFKP